MKVFLIRKVSFLFLCAWILSSALASEKEVIRSVIAFDVTAKINRGGEVEIPLEAVPNYGNRITFEIKTPPLHGTLSAPLNTSDHTALVTYHHDGSNEPQDDEFSFRAKSIGRAKSVAYTVRIHILPPPAAIVFEPEILDFGEVMLSEKRQLKLKLSNIGGVRAIGRVLLPRGFSTPEGDGFNLSEGEQIEIPICFSPVELHTISVEATLLPPLCKKTLLLTGSGHARFEVSKKDPVSWEIKNLSSASIRINFSGGEGWLMPPENLVLPHASQLVSFQQEVDEGQEAKADQKSQVQISDGLSTSEIELPQAKRFIPVSVQLLSQESLGSIPIGGSTTISFRLINRSEFQKQIIWKVSSPSGGGTTSSKSLDLRGGEEKDITFDWVPTLPGTALLKISLREGVQEEQEISCKAEILPGSTIQNSQFPSFQTPSIEVKNDEIINQPPPPSIPPLDDIISGVDTSWLGDKTSFLEWKSPQKHSTNLRVEEVCMIQTNGSSLLKNPTMKLIPVTIVQQIKSGDRCKIFLKNLSPGWHLLRITSSSSDNSIPDYISQLEVKIPPQDPWNQLKTPLGIFSLLILLILLIKIRNFSSG